MPYFEYIILYTVFMVNSFIRSVELSDINQIILGVYPQVSNISCTLVGNKIVDHSDVVGASPVGAAPTTSSFSTGTPGFIGSGKNNWKARWKTIEFGDLMRLILEILR